jgi:hypothetical protein
LVSKMCSMISIGRMQPGENHYCNGFPAWDGGLGSDWLSTPWP